MQTHFLLACFLLYLKTHFVLCPKTHFPARWSWSGDPCLNANRKKVKCRSKRPLPSGVFCKFCGYIWWYGCVWSPRKCGKVEKKNIVFVFLFFTMKPSRLKIMVKVFIFLWFNLLWFCLVAKKVWESWKFCFHFFFRLAPR